MPTFVIESFPRDPHAKLRELAAAHRRSVTQETIHLLEAVLAVEENQPEGGGGQPRWAKRKLLPEYEAILNADALDSADSAAGLSEERDAR